MTTSRTKEEKNHHASVRTAIEYLMMGGLNRTTSMTKAVDHVEGITSNPDHTIHLVLQLGHVRAIGGGAQAVKAGISVGHGGADPSQGVTHLKPKR